MALFKKKKLVILSLGGSLIYPQSGLNINFLNSFNKLIRRHIAKGTHFFIVCGGGKLSRLYQKTARSVVGQIPDEDIDWLGIHVTRMNAQLLRTIFADICYPKVLYHYDEKETHINKPVVIAAGWKPGWSTDYCAVLLAKDYGVKTIINLSNIEVVYNKDPQKYPDAKPIEKISWENFEKIVGDKWVPGANIPFDPIATKLAKESNLTVFIIKGSNLKNLDRLLEEKPFKGTIILPFKLNASFYNQNYFEFGIGYKGYTTTLQGKLTYHLVNFYRALLIKLFLNPKKLLDIGCGTGLLVYYLRKMGVEAYGLDVSRYAISKAYPSIIPYLRVGNILKLPYPTGSFDIVITFNVLEHLEKEKIPKALLECHRVRTKYSLHKVYTLENRWMEKFHPQDISQISVLPQQWWQQLFNQLGLKQASVLFPRLPSFMETIFILS